MSGYGDPKYWEKRYKDEPESTFDWYQCPSHSNRLSGYESLKPFIKELITLASKILVLGCGNSELSEQLYDDGFPLIDSIDISASVISQMRVRNLAREKMKFEVMDVRELHYDAMAYDLVLDKGTLDAILCGENSAYNAAKMVKVGQRGYFYRKCKGYLKLVAIIL